MRLAAFALGFVVAAVSAYAQESLVGIYNGSFNWQTQSRGVIPLPISLKITSVADGKVQATAIRGHNNKAGQGCAGEYKMSGTYGGNKLDLKSEAGGPAGDCSMHLMLVVEDRKLKGTLGDKAEVEMHK